MQIITLEDVKKASRIAYDAGRLGAQMPNAGPSCSYSSVDADGNVYHCGIGAAMSSEVHKGLLHRNKNTNAINILVVSAGTEDLFQLDGPLSDFQEIQSAHDNWQFLMGRLPDPSCKVAENKFLKLIEHPSVMPQKIKEPDRVLEVELV